MRFVTLREILEMRRRAPGRAAHPAAVAAAKQAQTETGVTVAVELVEAAKSMVAGIYLMPPFKRYEMVPAIMEGAGISRPKATAQ